MASVPIDGAGRKEYFGTNVISARVYLAWNDAGANVCS